MIEGRTRAPTRRPPPPKAKTPAVDTNCFNPIVEGTSDEQRAAYMLETGIDPVASFPAAEGFCNSFADDQGQFDEFLFSKCQDYAKQYVPAIVLEAFQAMHKIGNAASFEAKRDGMYAFDHQIEQGTIFGGACVTPASTAACNNYRGRASNVPAACDKVAASFKSEFQDKFAACTQRFNVFSCLEGLKE